MMILTLILMECLLSVDNAVVLAVQTQVLPTKDEQRKSLVYGLWGAYLFRFIVIGIGTYLINFWEIKLLGGLYLLYLVYRYFYDIRHPEQVAKKEAAKKENHTKKIPTQKNIIFHYFGELLFQSNLWILSFQSILFWLL